MWETKAHIRRPVWHLQVFVKTTKVILKQLFLKQILRYPDSNLRD